MRLDFVALAAIFFSVHLTGTAQTASTAGNEGRRAKAQQIQQREDSLEIRATMLRFYDWYAARHTKVAAFNIWRREPSERSARVDHDVLHRLHKYLRRQAPELGSEFYDWDLLVVWEDAPTGADSATLREVFIPTDHHPKEFPAWLRSRAFWEILVFDNEAHVSLLGDTKDEDDAPLYTWMFRKERGRWRIALIAGEVQ